MEKSLDELIADLLQAIVEVVNYRAPAHEKAAACKTALEEDVDGQEFLAYFTPDTSASDE